MKEEKTKQKMFLVDEYNSSQLIKKVTVDKVTNSSVWIYGERSLRLSKYKSYFFTFEEAKEYLLDKSDRMLTEAQEYKNRIIDIQEKDVI